MKIAHQILGCDNLSLHQWVWGIWHLLTWVGYHLGLCPCAQIWVALYRAWLDPGTCQTLPFAFGTKTKLLHHSNVSSTPRGSITCYFCNWPSSFLSGFWRAYGILLNGAWYGQLPSLTCNLYVPLKHWIPKNHHLRLIVIYFLFCFKLCPTRQKF